MGNFEHPEWFWGLFPLAGIAIGIILVLRQRRKRLLKYYSLSNLEKMGLMESLKKSVIRYGLWCMGMVALLFALANPRIAGADKEVDILGSDVVFVLDISRSMRVEDVIPSRLHVARQFLEKLLSEIPGERVGLVFFAGAAYVQMPLSADHAAAKMFIRQASPDLISDQGTAIGEALAVAADLFDDESNTGRTLILVTDGEDHEPEAMEKFAAISKDAIDVVILGVGTSTGGILPHDAISVSTEESHQPVFSRMSPDILGKIAEGTGGKFMLLQDNTEELIRAIHRQLKDKERTKRAVQLRTAYTSLYQWPLGFAILCFIGFIMWPFRSLFLPKKSMAIVLLWGVMQMGSLYGQSFHREMKKGEKSFDQGEFQRAATHFGAVANRGEGQDKALYNRGTSRMAEGNLSGAKDDFEKVRALSKDSTLLAKASYQLGSILLQEEDWDGAEMEFIQSLKWNPGDQKAAHNLMFCRQKRKESPQNDSSEDDASNQQQQDDSQPNESSINEANEPKEGGSSSPSAQQNQSPSTRMSKQEAEKLLEALQKEEARARARQKIDGKGTTKSGKNW